MSRKTIQVEELRERVNALLAAAASASQLESAAERRAQRLGAAAVLESALHSTGNYRGYQFLPSEFLPAGERSEDGSVLRPGYDDSRRRYL